MKNGIFIALIALLLLLSATPASAGKTSAVINGKSYHFNSSYEWNENNIGLGIEHEFTQQSAWKKVAMASGFRDSSDNMAYLAGAGLHRRIFESERLAGFHVYAGLNAFVMTRDDVNGGKPFPGILPSITVGNDVFGVNLTYLPKQGIEQSTQSKLLDPTLSGVLFLQLKVSLDQILP